MDNYGQLLNSEHYVDLKVILPFEVAQEVTNLHNVALDSVSINEDFMLKCGIRNTSTRKLRLRNCTSTINVSCSS